RTLLSSGIISMHVASQAGKLNLDAVLRCSHRPVQSFWMVSGDQVGNPGSATGPRKIIGGPETSPSNQSITAVELFYCASIRCRRFGRVFVRRRYRLE